MIVEILSSLALLLLIWIPRGPIKIVEHQVHVRPLLPLKMINNGFVPVDLDLDVRLCLARESPRFMKIAAVAVRLLICYQ